MKKTLSSARSLIRSLALSAALTMVTTVTTGIGAVHAATPIFVLHSYSQEYPWTAGQNEGFVKAMNEADLSIEPVLSTEYLDTKRRSYDPAFARAMADHLRVKYAGYQPAAIYVSDDNALLFARDYLRDIFPGAPVFFSGVNDYGMRGTLDPRYFTGVFEKKEVRPNLEWLLRFDPKLRDLVFVGDGSNTDKAIETEARKDLSAFPQIRARFIGEKRIDRIIAALKEDKAEYVVLTTLGGVTDAEGRLQPLAHTLRMLREAGRRMVSMEDGYVMQGVMGGYVTRGPEQGAGAAHLLLQYLNGRLVNDLPAVLKSPNAHLFDDAVLEAHDMELPAAIAAHATLLNPRVRFVDTHRTFILATLYFLAAALFIVLLSGFFVVSRKNRQLLAAREEADFANQAKSHFLANMSHEIRTPLTSIIGFADLLMHDKLDGSQRAEALPSILRNGHHLLELINNILDLAKIENGSVTLEKLPLKTGHLLRELGALADVRAKAKSVKFEIVPELPLPAGFVSDPVRLKQILVNFLSNAIKFTPKGKVELRVAYSAQPPTLIFAVKDSGIGMTPEQVGRLFQRFVQADISTTRRFGGTGLGLHLCQQLAQLMGGRIEVRSELRKGSCFTLHLPLEQVPETMIEDAGALRLENLVDMLPAFEVPVLSGRVLLAEDGLDNQRLISAYLRQAGVEVTVVANGRHAVEAALSEDFDLVLMDIQMPEMDGVTATETLRGVGFSRPIVALTANIMKSEVQHYLEIGCQEVLSKPIERAKFYSALAQLLKGGSERRQAPVVKEDPTLAIAFRAGLPAQVETIDRALVEKNWARLRQQAHLLKGTAGSFGFPVITEIAGRLEGAAADSDVEHATALCDSLRGQVQAALGEAA
ncbi:MAG TPA: ATP-binding protein [Burkholderiales bacterium]|nr:ATP-binding protein [Burkholderiales bacterium]